MYLRLSISIWQEAKPKTLRNKVKVRVAFRIHVGVDLNALPLLQGF